MDTMKHAEMTAKKVRAALRIIGNYKLSDDEAIAAMEAEGYRWDVDAWEWC